MLEFMTQPITKWQFAAVACLIVALSSAGQAGDWMTWPSTYTHDCHGVKVDQYAMPVQPVGPNREGYERSGYRHFRSTLQVGQSADNYHVVEQFGRPVEPYENWRFPFRPYGVPYDAWGPQTPFALSVGGVGGFGRNPGFYPPHAPHPHASHPGTGAPGTGTGGMPGGMPPGGMPPGTGGMPPPGYPYGHPGMGGWGGQPLGFPLQPQYQNQPWFDGTHPDAPALDNRTDQQFFSVPAR
jgi:hypothetical protein